MRSLRPSAQSLTQRFGILVAALIVTITVLLGLSAASGVYEMARREESARQRAYLDVATQQIENRFTVARRVVTTLRSREAILSGDRVSMQNALGDAIVDNPEYIKLLFVASEEGTVAASSPGMPELTAREITAFMQDTLAPEEPTVVWRAATGEDANHPWAVMPFVYRSGERGYLFAQLDMEPIGSALEQVAAAPGGPTAAVLSASGSPLFMAGDGEIIVRGELDFREVDEEHRGVVSARLPDGSRFVGYHTTLSGTLGWQVVVLESSEMAIRETWAALRSAVFTWTATVVVVMIVALAMVTRLVRPLRDLERRANAVARGAYAEPVEVTRRDEIGRLLEAFNSVAARLDRMHDVSQVLARSSEREEVLDGILSSVGHMLGTADVDVLLLTEDAREFELSRAIGALSGRVGLCLLRDESPWLTHAIHGGGAVHFEGDFADDTLLKHHVTYGARALAVPLVVGLETLGLIVVVSCTEDGFSNAEVEMVRSFAAQSSVALHNAKLFSEERRSRREAEVLLTVAERIARTGVLAEAIDDVLGVESELLGMPIRRALILHRDDYGLPPSDEPALESELAEAWLSLFGSAADDPVGPQAMYVVRDSAERGLRAFMESFGVASMVLTPLAVEGRLLGMLAVGSETTIVRVTPRHMRVAEVIGTQLSLALQNEMLYEQARGRADNLETVFRISQAVSSSLQSKVVLNRVLDVVQKIFSADAVILMTYDADRRSLLVPMARGLLHRDMLDAEYAPGEDLPGRVFASKQPERFDSLESIDTSLANVARAQGLESLLVVPLLARGRSIGVLSVLARDEAAFGDDDMELLRTFASQAALAIDNARMFSREHHVASVLQGSILPSQLPRIEGIDSSSIYLPAGSEADIGGDYYDLFRAPDERLVMAIGDVCGKGVEAATKTSMIKYSIRGMVVAGLEPAAIMREVNTMLIESGDATNIVTLWMGFLDVDEGRLVYANGGHPPALLLQPSDGRLERLSTTGALLGAVAGADYDQETMYVEPDAVLLLYTDGVTEARNKSRFFGEGRVRRALKLGGSAAAVTQRLLAQVQRFSGGDLRDDAAILTVRRLPAREAEVVSLP
ncbi:MAG: SpoIIE family protein phosphatase [Coriobacteriia bacterium]|nr:SpoIIE family protein phosphatase [Coriobacteriia bacterium]